MKGKVFLESEIETFANTDVAIKDTVTEEQKKQIEAIFDMAYGDCEYIQKVDGLHYRGDMGCIAVLGTEVTENLEKKHLYDCLNRYYICKENSTYKEDMLDD